MLSMIILIIDSKDAWMKSVVALSVRLTTIRSIDTGTTNASPVSQFLVEMSFQFDDSFFYDIHISLPEYVNTSHIHFPSFASSCLKRDTECSGWIDFCLQYFNRNDFSMHIPSLLFIFILSGKSGYCIAHVRTVIWLLSPAEMWIDIVRIIGTPIIRTSKNLWVGRKASLKYLTHLQCNECIDTWI